jgi:hypothetical protein
MKAGTRRRRRKMPFYKVEVTAQFKFRVSPSSEEYIIIKSGSEPQITQSIHWPNRCPCCGGEGDTHMEIRFSDRHPGLTGGVAETLYTIPIPYCQACLNHVKSAVRGMWLWGMTGILVFTIMGGIGIQTALNGSSPWVMATLFLLGAVGGYLGGRAFYKLYNSRVVTPMLREKCCSPYAAVNPGGSGAQGHIFFFREKEYAKEFARLNGVEDVQEIKSLPFAP